MSNPKDEVVPWVSQIRVNDSIENTNGLSNAITTTKYSIFSWLPKSLWEQFRRIANIYFLGISILMLIGTYATELWETPLDAWSTVGTLVVVLMITSIKEGLEDVQRHKSDKADNIAMVTVVKWDDEGKMVETQMQKQYIKSGDVIKMVGKTQVPVDMLLLVTSNYLDGNQCYIETSNIDGETNLKLREAPSALMNVCSTIPKGSPPPVSLFKGKVEFEPANKNIHNFIGALHLDCIPNDPLALSADNILLRSSLFTNTDWAYGIAIYTGKETKIQMNNRHAQSKVGRLEQYLNSAIIMIFIAQVLLVTSAVIALYALDYNEESMLPYVYPPGHTGSGSVLPLWLEQWVVFFLLFNNFIPISLYVTIELVNVGQAFMIENDIQIYEESLDCPAVVRSSNLCQELGMVSNVFSDKTGTLTCNEMKFVKFVVGGTFYEVKSADTVALDSKGQPTVGDSNNPVLRAIHEGRNDGSEKAKKHSDQLLDFLRCLSVCHTVVREKDGTYRAESPDELALVEGVDHFRCHLIERSTAGMIVSLVGERSSFEVLAVNAFNADRKRMSILVTTPPKAGEKEPSYYLMCKGADNIIMALCTMTEEERQRADKNLLDFAMLGLRTLCISHKKLSQKVALDWVAKYRAAAASINERAEKLADVAAEIEVDLELIGITAIEDKLQDEVPQVIAEMAKAGIIVWMLTGDKEETAVSIARSCNLVTNNTKTHFISRIDNKESYNTRLKFVYDDMMAKIDPSTGKYMEDGAPVEVAVVMDGPSYKFFDDKNLNHRQWLLAIGKGCRSVVACRLTPVQKQMLVRLVKKDTVPKATTLAIGDGANDVSMIREGNVGVGIFGKEGRQAANNADFAIGQFKFLRRLLLVHGRWNYTRQSRVFLYCMHKNMVLTLTLYWYCYYAAMSGTALYESWVYTGYNFILGLPIIFYGFLDKDLTQEFQQRWPQTYYTGRANSFLNLPAISVWIFNAGLYALIICLLGYVVLWDTLKDMDLYVAGTMVYTALCMALQFKVCFLHHQWAYPNVFTIFISVVGMLLYFYVLNILYSYVPDYADEFNNTANQVVYWFFCFFSIPLIAVLIDLFGHSLHIFFQPTMENLFREMELEEKFRHPCRSEPIVSQNLLGSAENRSSKSYKSDEPPTDANGGRNWSGSSSGSSRPGSVAGAGAVAATGGANLRKNSNAASSGVTSDIELGVVADAIRRQSVEEDNNNSNSNSGSRKGSTASVVSVGPQGTSPMHSRKGFGDDNEEGEQD